MLRVLLLLGLLATAASSANATILTFDIGGAFLPAGYGDNVSQASSGGLTYLEGAGFTPSVTIAFLPDAPFGEYTVYGTGYAGTLLPNALGHGSFNVPGEIVLTPSGGAQVLLHGFDLGTWGGAAFATEIRIWDDNGTRASPNLFTYSATLDGNTVYSPLSGVITATGALHIFISNLGSTGLDNLHFSQVPEPGASALLAFGFAAALLARRRSGVRRR
jgi:hypothetical protein